MNKTTIMATLALCISMLLILIPQVNAGWSCSVYNAEYYWCDWTTCGFDSYDFGPMGGYPPSGYFQCVGMTGDPKQFGKWCYGGYAVWENRKGSSPYGIPWSGMDITYNIAHDGNEDYMKIKYEWTWISGPCPKENMTILWYADGYENGYILFSSKREQTVWSADYNMFFPFYSYSVKNIRSPTTGYMWGELYIYNEILVGGTYWQRVLLTRILLGYESFDYRSSPATLNIVATSWRDGGGSTVKHHFFSWGSEVIVGDVDDNRVVNMLDSYAVATKFGQSSPQPPYQQGWWDWQYWNLDLVPDGTINMLDLYEVNRVFGTQLT